MAKILVTGGCGFIGRNLVEQLIKNKHTVTVVDNLMTGGHIYISLYRKWGVPVIIKNIERLTELNAEIVINCAAQTGVQQSIARPFKDATTNILGLLNLLTLSKDSRITRFIHISSFAVLVGGSPYALSKKVGENYLELFSALYGLETIGLRLSNVYGPFSEHKTSVVAKWIQQRTNGEPLTVVGDGSQTRDFIHVSDVVSAITQATTKTLPEDHMILPVCTGVETPVNTIASMFGGPMEYINTGYWESPRESIDPYYTNVVLDWSAKIPVVEGIKKML